MKKIFTISLTVLLLICLGCICSCKQNDTDEKTTMETLSTETVSPKTMTYVIVRPLETNETIVRICSNLQETLVAQGLNATVEKDNKVAFSDQTDIMYILVGETSQSLSHTNQARVTEAGDVSFLMEENRLSVCAQNDQALWMAIEDMVRTCSKNGVFTFFDTYRDYRPNFSGKLRDGWSFYFPAYTTGELDEKIYSCGYGLVESNELSYMHVINGTNAKEFAEWRSLIAACGYREVFRNTIEENQYLCYQDMFGTIYYAYYLNGSGKVRVILRSIV